VVDREAPLLLLSFSPSQFLCSTTILLMPCLQYAVVLEYAFVLVVVQCTFEAVVRCSFSALFEQLSMSL